MIEIENTDQRLVYDVGNGIRHILPKKILRNDPAFKPHYLGKFWVVYNWHKNYKTNVIMPASPKFVMAWTLYNNSLYKYESGENHLLNSIKGIYAQHILQAKEQNPTWWDNYLIHLEKMRSILAEAASYGVTPENLWTVREGELHRMFGDRSNYSQNNPRPISIGVEEKNVYIDLPQWTGEVIVEGIRPLVESPTQKIEVQVAPPKVVEVIVPTSATVSPAQSQPMIDKGIVSKDALSKEIINKEASSDDESKKKRNWLLIAFAATAAGYFYFKEE
jgi:hypothetical protein